MAALIAIPVLADVLTVNAAPAGFWAQFHPGLYYVSIVIAGIAFGWKAGLAIACVGALAHALVSHYLLASPWIGLEGETLLFLVVGFAFIEQRRKLSVQTQFANQNERIDCSLCVEQVSEIASAMLREIRTPLASIEGAAFILKDDEGDVADPIEFIQIIHRECRRVQDVLAQIAGCAEMHPLTFAAADVGSLLEEAVRLSALEVPDPSIALRTDVEANLPMVWCDKKQILDILVPSITGTMRAITGGGEVLLAADRLNGHARIRLAVLGQTVRAADPAGGRRGPFSSLDHDGGALRLLAARRILLQHGGTLQVAETGLSKKLQSLTIPLYNGQRR